MRKILAGLALVGALSLTACGAVTEGTVTDVEFKEAWSEEVEITEQDCDTKYKTVAGKRKSYQSCETEGTGEYETVNHPAEYVVTFENDEGEEGTDTVSEDEGAEIEVGDFYKED